MVASNTPLAIWERVLLRDGDTVSPQSAEYLLQLDFSESDHARMEELSAKSSVGPLSPSEQDELANYVRIGHLLALLQSKARVALRPGTVGANGHG